MKYDELRSGDDRQVFPDGNERYGEQNCRFSGASLPRKFPSRYRALREDVIIGCAGWSMGIRKTRALNYC
jgi:hypothetical protein